MNFTDKKGTDQSNRSHADAELTESQARQIAELQSKLAEKEKELRETEDQLASIIQKMKRREEQANLFFRKMLNGFTVNRIILDDRNEPVDFEVLEANEAFLKTTKLNREEIIGVPISRFIPEVKDPGSNILQYAAAVALNGESFVGELYFETFAKWFEASAYSVQQGYFNVVYKDVTRRREMEEELEASRAFLEYSLNSAPDGVLLLASDMRFSFVNPAFSEIFDVSPADLIGKSIPELCPTFISEDEVSWLNKGTIELMENGEPVKGAEFNFRNPAGVLIPATFSAARITDKNNRPLGIVTFIKDITERKRTQELMIQTEKMMSVGGLAAGMAHEINNPLGGMLQGAQNIIRRLSPELEVNRRDARECGLDLDRLDIYIKRRKIDEMLEGILISGKRAANIITNMLQFSRQSESNLCPNDINGLIDEVLELCANDYDLTKKHDFRKIEIVKKYDPDLPLVPCTKTEIEQVILNLLKNATHAMTRTSGHRPPRITIRTLIEGRFARIEIQDNGPGLNTSDKSRVFEPFFTTKPVGQGTGLGLSVSYMIVTNNHKGSMEVTSELEEGACFIVSLPLHNKAVSQPSAEKNGGK